jgi:hypothetical protein
MDDATKEAIKTSSITGLGALLGGGVGAAYPQINPFLKYLPLKNKINKDLIKKASGATFGSHTGGLLASTIGKDDINSALGAEGGGIIGGTLGAASAIPLTKINPKYALLNFLLGTTIGVASGAASGEYLANKYGLNKNVKKVIEYEM